MKYDQRIKKDDRYVETRLYHFIIIETHNLITEQSVSKPSKFELFNLWMTPLKRSS